MKITRKKIRQLIIESVNPSYFDRLNQMYVNALAGSEPDESQLRLFLQSGSEEGNSWFFSKIEPIFKKSKEIEENIRYLENELKKDPYGYWATSIESQIIDSYDDAAMVQRQINYLKSLKEI